MSLLFAAWAAERAVRQAERFGVEVIVAREVVGLRDEEGFVLAGSALDGKVDWKLDRPRYLLETSLPGVFVAGDVRAGSVKRVGAAVGEGSMVIQFIHNHLRGAG